MVSISEANRSIEFSRNFAASKPNIGLTEKEHILGLASIVERLSAQLEEIRADRDSALQMLGISLDEWQKLSR